MDSEVTFEEDSDEEMDTIEIEEEDWIEYIKRSTADALDKMERAKIRCWNRTHKKMKWKLALIIATSPSERWLRKAAEWNPDLSSRYKTNRAIGRLWRMTHHIPSYLILHSTHLPLDIHS